MENKNHPTIEEIIERYKDAEEVECLYFKKPMKLSFKKPFEKSELICDDYYDSKKLWMNTTDRVNCAVYDYETQQFAKITKYKTEINLSKITPDFVRELCKEENIKEAFEREGVLVEKPKLKTGKWYKNKYGAMWFFQGKDVRTYGFTAYSSFMKNVYIVWDNNFTEATPTEVIERLKAEAVKKYEGKKVVCLNSNNPYKFDSNLLKYYFKADDMYSNGAQIYKKGVWAEIYTEPKPAYIQVPISEIDNLSSKKLGRFVKELRENY